MATEFSFTVSNQPGAFAKIAEVLGNAGVNIHGGGGVHGVDSGFIRLVTDNPESARTALKNAGLEFGENEVLTVNLDNSPGKLAHLTRELASKGVFSSIS